MVRSLADRTFQLSLGLRLRAEVAEPTHAEEVRDGEQVVVVRHGLDRRSAPRDEEVPDDPEIVGSDTIY